MSEQIPVDAFRELNRYTHHDEEWPSEAVYAPPRRTVANGWVKYHAARDCGRQSVLYVENPSGDVCGSDKWEYKLRCTSCGHFVDETEVLFIGGDWFSRKGIEIAHQTVDDIWLSPEAVLELGPDPEQDELVEALRIGRIETEISIHGVTFGHETTDECADCGQDALITFGDHCGMCYDGPITDQMRGYLESLTVSIRERNDSFAHRLPGHVDPLDGSRIMPGTILWRRSSPNTDSDTDTSTDTNTDTNTTPTPDYPKVVEVTQALVDDTDGHREYILRGLSPDAEEQRVKETAVGERFYDTRLSVRHSEVDRDDLRERFEQYVDR